MSRQERLREIKRMAGPSGESRNQSTINYWTDRVSENSLHPGRKAKPQAGGMGRSDDNHIADGESYLPGVRRSET